MSFILGLTGPTGAGKSSLRKKAEQLGFYVIDCDKTARKAAENQNCKAELKKAFGEDILSKNGDLVRSKLAQKAFCSRDKTELLNSIIFPYIKELLSEEISTARNKKILLDAPTLFESGTDALCDAVVAVLADKGERTKRIMARDKIEKEAALLRINAGKSEQYYKEKTPYILYNNGRLEEIYDNFEKIINTIFGG